MRGRGQAGGWGRKSLRPQHSPETVSAGPPVRRAPHPTAGVPGLQRPGPPSGPGGCPDPRHRVGCRGSSCRSPLCPLLLFSMPPTLLSSPQTFSRWVQYSRKACLHKSSAGHTPVTSRGVWGFPQNIKPHTCRQSCGWFTSILVMPFITCRFHQFMAKGSGGRGRGGLGWHVHEPRSVRSTVQRAARPTLPMAPRGGYRS